MAPCSKCSSPRCAPSFRPWARSSARYSSTWLLPGSPLPGSSRSVCARPAMRGRARGACSRTARNRRRAGRCDGLQEVQRMRAVREEAARCAGAPPVQVVLVGVGGLFADAVIQAHRPAGEEGRSSGRLATASSAASDARGSPVTARQPRTQTGTACSPTRRRPRGGPRVPTASHTVLATQEITTCPTRSTPPSARPGA